MGTDEEVEETGGGMAEQADGQEKFPALHPSESWAAQMFGLAGALGKEEETKRWFSWGSVWLLSSAPPTLTSCVASVSRCLTLHGRDAQLGSEAPDEMVSDQPVNVAEELRAQQQIDSDMTYKLLLAKGMSGVWHLQLTSV
ncbi:unnamed protein product [Pleuronectes platessa]|uniref:Uncharacterized protein n=1 Tax=Pleuronectes platessa TaxID=8262 RepID=A0A9N7ZED8_PLEPL|nr:unnamed protein product [Pleuronectes platessa]